MGRVSVISNGWKQSEEVRNMADERFEFVPPDFVSGSNPEEIQERMMNNLPADIDDMPGGFPYDFTMPTALEKSELIQFHLVRTLMLMFPMWAWVNGLICMEDRRESAGRKRTGQAGILHLREFPERELQPDS